MAQDDDSGSEGSFGSRFLSGLKGLILEDEVPSKQANAAEPASAAPATAKPAPQAPGAQAPVASALTSAATSESPMYANLLSVTLARTTAYTALTEAMTPLEEIIPDEMTRYRAAFAVIKKNRTLDQLIQAIDMQHMEVLEQEVARFSVQAKSKQYQDVEARLEEAANLKASIEAANAKVAALRRQLDEQVNAIEQGIQRDRERAAEIDRAVEENRQAITQVQQQFDSAASAVRANLGSAKAKIVKYLS